MAAAPAIVPTVQGDAAGSDEVQKSESISANMWAGNAVGTLAFLWATVVLLGGFSTLLSRMDFWFAMVMIFVEGSRCVP
nr:unnamed protein product [Digitaria exilis]